MVLQTILAIVLFGLVPAPVSCTVESFGSICSLGEFYAPNCPCGLGIVLIDCDGNIMPTSMGPSKLRPHSGFRFGSIDPSAQAAISIEESSIDEASLVSKMWEYLEKVLGPQDQVRTMTTRMHPDYSEDKKRAIYLARMIQRFEWGVESRQWLNARFSKEEQARIISSNFLDLETEVEKEAFKKICGLKWGQLHASANRLIDPETGQKYDYEWKCD